MLENTPTEGRQIEWDEIPHAEMPLFGNTKLGDLRSSFVFGEMTVDITRPQSRGGSPARRVGAYGTDDDGAPVPVDLGVLKHGETFLLCDSFGRPKHERVFWCSETSQVIMWGKKKTGKSPKAQAVTQGLAGLIQPVCLTPGTNDFSWAGDLPKMAQTIQANLPKTYATRWNQDWATEWQLASRTTITTEPTAAQTHLRTMISRNTLILQVDGNGKKAGSNTIVLVAMDPSARDNWAAALTAMMQMSPVDYRAVMTAPYQGFSGALDDMFGDLLGDIAAMQADAEAAGVDINARVGRMGESAAAAEREEAERWADERIETARQAAVDRDLADARARAAARRAAMTSEERQARATCIPMKARVLAMASEGRLVDESWYQEALRLCDSGEWLLAEQALKGVIAMNEPEPAGDPSTTAGVGVGGGGGGGGSAEMDDVMIQVRRELAALQAEVEDLHVQCDLHGVQYEPYESAADANARLPLQDDAAHLACMEMLMVRADMLKKLIRDRPMDATTPDRGRDAFRRASGFGSMGDNGDAPVFIQSSTFSDLPSFGDLVDPDEEEAAAADAAEAAALEAAAAKRAKRRSMTAADKKAKVACKQLQKVAAKLVKDGETDAAALESALQLVKGESWRDAERALRDATRCPSCGHGRSAGHQCGGGE